MATLYAVHGVQNWDGNWCDADDNVADTPRENTSDLILNNAACSLTMAEDIFTCNSLTINLGTVTFGFEVEFAGDFDLAGGTFAGSDDFDIDGDLTYSSGTNSNTGAWTHDGVGRNVSWITSTQGIRDYRLAAGATINRTGDVTVHKITIPATATLTGVHHLTAQAYANDFISVDGDIAGAGKQVIITPMTGAVSNSSAINISAGKLTVRGDEKLYTQTGKVNVPGMAVYAKTVDHVAQFKLSGSGHDIGDVQIGSAASNKGGTFDFDNCSVKVGDVIGGLASKAINVVDFGSAYIEIQDGKSMDFDDGAAGSTISSFIADDGAAHIVGIGTVTVDWVLPDADTDTIHCHECVKGGNNHAARVTFDEHAHPGSLATMGVGI